LSDDLKSDPLFQDDETVRNFIYAIGQMNQTLTDAEGDEVFKKAVHTFNKEIDVIAVYGRLRELLAKLIAAFEALRKERLRSAPLDEGRMGLVRQAMTKDVLTFGPSIACFRNFPIRRDDSGKLATTEQTFGVIPKGLLLSPRCRPLISMNCRNSSFFKSVRFSLGFCGAACIIARSMLYQ
jgi:hypothetical protein